MVGQYLTIIGSLISAFIDIFLYYDFFEGNYSRRFQKKWVNYIVILILVVVLAAVNFFQIVFLNFAIWMVICSLFGFYLYYDEKEGKRHTFFKALLMYIVVCLIELVSYFLLKFAISGMHKVIISISLYNFLNLTVAKILNIILYFVLLKNLLGKNRLRKLSYWYYITYCILVLMNFSSTFMVVSAIEYIQDRWESAIIILNLITVLIINLYILRLLNSLAENTELKIQLAVFEQQETMQGKYYVSLDKRYKQSLKILHDVDKHIGVIERLYRKGDLQEAMEYTWDIRKMLFPLIPRKYANHNILNIILNDKAETAKKNEIEFRCCMEDIDYDFIRSVDITTIFSNLLDNAIEACVKKRRKDILISVQRVIRI